MPATTCVCVYGFARVQCCVTVCMWFKIMQKRTFICVSTRLSEIFVTLFFKCKTTNCNLISNKDLHLKKKKVNKTGLTSFF